MFGVPMQWLGDFKEFQLFVLSYREEKTITKMYCKFTLQIRLGVYSSAVKCEYPDVESVLTICNQYHSQSIQACTDQLLVPRTENISSTMMKICLGRVIVNVSTVSHFDVYF